MESKKIKINLWKNKKEHNKLDTLIFEKYKNDKNRNLEKL